MAILEPIGLGGRVAWLDIVAARAASLRSRAVDAVALTFEGGAALVVDMGSAPCQFPAARSSTSTQERARPSAARPRAAAASWPGSSAKGPSPSARPSASTFRRTGPTHRSPDPRSE